MKLHKLNAKELAWVYAKIPGAAPLKHWRLYSRQALIILIHEAQRMTEKGGAK